MITAQDIREKTFDKARIGGYDMASVDDFLEELAEDVTAAQKENAVLKSKMKILVDKIEEYRANEEALNMAVLSAQKLAVQIESEARERARAMLAEADRQVNAKIGGIAEQADAEESRLAAAKSSTRGHRQRLHPRGEGRRRGRRSRRCRRCRSGPRARSGSGSRLDRGRGPQHRAVRLPHPARGARRHRHHARHGKERSGPAL